MIISGILRFALSFVNSFPWFQVATNVMILVLSSEYTKYNGAKCIWNRKLIFVHPSYFKYFFFSFLQNWIIKTISYRGSPTYTKITNRVSTTSVFGLCMCKWGIFALGDLLQSHLHEFHLTWFFQVPKCGLGGDPLYS